MKNEFAPASTQAGNPWTRFWFTPIPITGMKVLRVLSGLLFLAWLLSFLGHQGEFFSLNGFFDKPAYEETLPPQQPAETSCARCRICCSRASRWPCRLAGRSSIVSCEGTSDLAFTGPHVLGPLDRS